MPGHRKRRQFKQTDAFTRGMVIRLKRAGWSIRQIAADTHLGASTECRCNQSDVSTCGSAYPSTSSGGPTSHLYRAILQHVQDTLDHSISTRTISRRLVANGLHSCRPLRRLPLTPPNRRQRLEWCRARSTWMTEWHRVVFSDESRFCLSSDSRRVRVWRRRRERSNPAAIVERPTVRQRGIMVWGAIAYDSRSPLLRIQGTMMAQRYVDDVLRPVTLPYLQGVPNALYQQDNARPHTARIRQQALQDVQMLPWPPYSPDLSPIEHVWDIIGRRLHALPQPPIPQDAIRTLIDSLPRRVAACIAVREGSPEPPSVEDAPKIIAAIPENVGPSLFSPGRYFPTYLPLPFYPALVAGSRDWAASALVAPQKAFVCKQCPKSYSSLGALKMHIRTHTLPCKCKLCGKAFSRPWLLQGHVRTHTGEKPFACSFCKRAFADRSNLRAHLQTHSLVKKYACSHCGKPFSRLSLVSKHEYSCRI
ncbi:SNAI1 [Cordylochernes scorpioides]|uniref:SNAI1 n=1 Tax=Cordylochernes scorpioides TaxID=51811 RepID=A0ABY6LGX8_9ARAC|nr:SNAI1 [Cordylochernes scorpioides]